MRVWKDLISGDEMVSDSFEFTQTIEDTCLEVKAKFVTKKEKRKLRLMTRPSLLSTSLTP